MNTLEAKIQSDLFQSVKDKDTVKAQVMRNIKKAIQDVQTAEVNAIKDPTDADILKIIQKMVKELEKPMKDFKENGRMDLYESYQAEVDVLKTFLPKMLTESEVEKIVDDTIANLSATSMKDMGKVMGFINKTYAGQVDGSMVSRIVKSKLA